MNVVVGTHCSGLIDWSAGFKAFFTALLHLLVLLLVGNGCTRHGGGGDEVYEGMLSQAAIAVVNVIDTGRGGNWRK